jgi:hypothetical protein
MTRRIFILSLLLTLPMFAMIAQAKNTSGLVVCGISTPGAPVPLEQQCDFIDLMNQVQSTMNFVIYQLATPVAVLMFAYAGFKLVTSQGDTNAMKDARKIFLNTLMGYGIMLSAFLIIKLIFSFLFPDNYSLLN